MTQEEIQQKAYGVYPLDLDRHLIIEGEPYDNNKEKREAYIRGLTDSKQELPSNLDEAANDGWAVYEYRESPRGLYSTCYVDGFKAGAEWMMKQMPMPEDTVLFNKGVEEGKRLMMEVAVEYEVMDFSASLETHPHVNIPLDNKKYRAGDKVRLVVLPKED